MSSRVYKLNRVRRFGPESFGFDGSENCRFVISCVFVSELKKTKISSIALLASVSSPTPTMTSSTSCDSWFGLSPSDLKVIFNTVALTTHKSHVAS